MPGSDNAGDHILHASAVALGQNGLLITGASGAGKSSLALQLIALGASLVADDRVCVRRDPEGALVMSCPPTINGMIEARGVGLMKLPAAAAVARAVVDLDQVETERLPDPRFTIVSDVRLPLIRRVEGPAFPSILFLYLQGGCVDI